MPLIEEEDLTPPAYQEPFISAQPYQGIAVDSQYTPLRDVIAYLEGSTWITDYYRGLYTKDMELTAQEVSQAAIYQSYQVIRGFELKVTAPLSPSQDEATTEHKLRGTANVPPCFRPNKGDMFTADIGDGRSAVLTVQSSRQLSWLRDAAFEIEYTVVDYLTEERQRDLERKITVDSTYDRKFLLSGGDPIVITSEFAMIQELRNYQQNLRELYWAQCFNYQFNTFLLPKQKLPTYDSFLMLAIEECYPQELRPPLDRLVSYVMDGDGVFKQPTIWDCLIRRSLAQWPLVMRDFDTIECRNYTQYMMYGSVQLSGLGRILFPKGRDVYANQYSTARYTTEHWPIESPYSKLEQDNIDLEYAVYRKVLNGTADVRPADMFVPLIHPIGLDDAYVFTEMFYKRVEFGQSRLELEVWKYLDGKPNDHRVLLELCRDTSNWGAMERFYLIPVLLILLRYNVKSM